MSSPSHPHAAVRVRLVAALLVAAACTCTEGIGTLTNGITLVDPAGPANEFARTLDLGPVRVATVVTKRIVLRNDGRADARVTKVELTTGTTELSLEGTDTLPRLSPGDSWEFRVRYFPDALGADTAQIVVETDAAETARYDITLLARGAASDVDACSIDAQGAEICAETQPDGSLVIDFGPVALDASATKPLVVRNRGDAALTIDRVALTEATREEFALAPEAPASVAAGQSFAFDVLFSPANGAVDEGFVELVTDDPDEPRVLVKLRAQGIAPALCVKPGATVPFGDVDTGTTATQLVTLESCGLLPLVLQSVSTFDDARGEFAATAPAPLPTLDPGQTVDVPVTYSPTNFGSDDGFLIVRSNDTGSALARILLSGRGVGCQLVATPSPVVFGNVSAGGRTARTVALQNTGVGECTITELRVTPAPFALDASPAFPITVAPGASTTAVVAFAPASSGSFAGELVAVNGTTEISTVVLRGSGTPPQPCDLQAIPTTLVFANVATGQTASQSVTLQNFGTESCYISEGAITRSNPASSVAYSASISGFPPPEIPSGGTFQVPVRFAPTTAGHHTGVLRLKYSDSDIPSFPPFPVPGSRTLDVALDGGTLEPKLCLSPFELDFGTVAANGSATQSFTITSCGPGSLGLRGLALLTGTSLDFGFQTRPSVPQFLPSGASVTVTMVYKPRTNAPDFGFVEVLSNDAAQPSAKVRLRGNAPTTCDRQLSCNTDRLRFPVLDMGRSGSLVLTCQNVGTQPLTVQAPAFSSGSSAEYKVFAGRAPFPRTLAPAGSMRLEVTYLPQDAGLDRGQLLLASDGCTPLIVDLEGAGRQPTYPRCIAGRVFQPQQKWAWNGGTIESASRNVGMSPLVLNLTDDNADGRVDEDDVPDVTFTSCKAGECCVNCLIGPGSTSFANMDTSGKGMLRAVHGRNGTDLWSVTDRGLMLTATAQIAAGDLDGDNVPEVIAVKHHFRPGSGSTGMDNKYAVGTLLVFDNTGRVKFETEPWSGESGTVEQSGAPTLGDVDGDGQVEIFFEKTVFASNGIKLRDLAQSSNDGHGSFAALSDLDGDGLLEIIQGSRTYRGDGTPYWTAPGGRRYGLTMVLDFDRDGRPEVVLRDTAQSFVILDGNTGAVKFGPTTWAGPVNSEGAAESVCSAAMAAADLDGDGTPELIIPAGDFLYAFRHTGQMLWRQPITDYGGQCGASGAAAFDFEGDGKFEAVYHDTEAMYVFRGTDGTRLYRAPRNSSTLFETPVIADVDNDGHADLLMTNENGILGIGANSGVIALSNQGNDWPSTRRIWNQHGYHQSDVNENGSIPRQETPHYKANNNWRAQPAMCRP